MGWLRRKPRDRESERKMLCPVLRSCSALTCFDSRAVGIMTLGLHTLSANTDSHLLVPGSVLGIQK